MIFIAFLRGINVSGQKIIKMTELAKIISDMKYKNVRTYIQSGNVIFQSEEEEEAKHEENMEKMLLKKLGYEVTVIVRSLKDIEMLIGRNPFRKIEMTNDITAYVTFLKHESDSKLIKPERSEKDGVEVLSVKGGNVFCLSFRMKSGQKGFPNLFIEKKFKVAATTRNWNTVIKVFEIANEIS